MSQNSDRDNSWKRREALYFVLAGLAVGGVAGLYLGWRHGKFQAALQENKVAAVNLRLRAANMAPQLREYLKGRIYNNVSLHYSGDEGYLDPKDGDFGPVDRDILGEVNPVKDPTSAVWDWKSAISNK